MDVYINDSFLGEDDLEFCLNFYQTVNGGQMWLPSVVDFWDGRTYDIANLLDDTGDRSTYARFMNILYRIRSEVYRAADEKRVMYPDTFQVVKWIDGDGQIPHADNVDIVNGTPGIAPWRLYSTVIYLNNDFVGGQTYFDSLGMQIEPVPGRLVAFSCGPEHVHGVRKINGGIRKTLISFWSDQHINRKINLLR